MLVAIFTVRFCLQSVFFMVRFTNSTAAAVYSVSYLTLRFPGVLRFLPMILNENKAVKQYADAGDGDGDR